MKALIALSFFGVMITTACNSGTGTTPSTPEPQRDQPAITGIHWKLVSLEGQAENMEESPEQERYIVLDTAGNRVSGFAGCNSILGTYALEEDMRIHFSNMGLTARLCPDGDIDEHAFMEVFALADNYTMVNGALRLNVGERGPLAVFENAHDH